MRILILLIVAVVSAFAGYWVGFRQAWDLSLMANAPVRGSIAVAHLKSLDNNRLGNVRATLDADIDTGLVWWSELEESPLSGALNLLSGEKVLPDRLQYVRRVASYRKTHSSPLSDPKVVGAMLESVREDDPELAKQMVEGGRESEAAMALMMKKYAE
jgi:hypothetical protein